MTPAAWKAYIEAVAAARKAYGRGPKGPMICRHCGAPIKYHRLSKGWLHASPLGQMRVSRREADDIHVDPPRRLESLHRLTFLHPAQPSQ